eukprot:TRINITY_DN8806_c0_g1_i1.p1 TRINITY_DN8806_c0_g1~~TRINITY_DN8806_c0_g1_i1.p1  ORF type:complete len:1244 (+),score=259.71 TRINITY_DN8806_c0_g1_i1:41-3772(+)
MAEPIAVFVRIRGSQPHEKEQPANLEIKKGTIFVGDKQFTFDEQNVLTAKVNNEYVWSKTTRSAIDSAFNGIASCIFTYGQSGSGKTYTTIGNDKINGIVQCTLSELFPKRDKMQANIAEFSVRLSCLEIFNENVYDLLAEDGGRQPMELWESADGQFPSLTVKAKGPGGQATFADIKDYASGLRTLTRALVNRKTNETRYSRTPGRSHVLYRIETRVRFIGSLTPKVGEIRIFDLAGADTATKSLTEEKTLGQSIAFLIRIVTDMATRKQGERPSLSISVRDSKLTRFLRPALGGTARCAVICTVNAYGDKSGVIQTLEFGKRCGRISNKPRPLVDSVALADISDIRKEKEILTLRVQHTEEQLEQVKLALETESGEFSPELNRRIKELNDLLSFLRHQLSQIPETLRLEQLFKQQTAGERDQVQARHSDLQRRISLHEAQLVNLRDQLDEAADCLSNLSEDTRSECYHLRASATFTNAALCSALMDGHVECMASLLKRQGGDANAFVDPQRKETLLHYAAQRNLKQCVELLLKHDASVKAADVTGSTPLHVATASGHLEIVKQLASVLSVAFRDKRTYTALHIAVQNGHVGAVRLLLAAGADANSQLDVSGGDDTDFSTATPLHLAIQHEHTACVQALLENMPNQKMVTAHAGSSCRTALHLAVLEHRADYVAMLLSAGSDIEAVCTHHIAGDEEPSSAYTPLALACALGYEDCAKVLIENNADITCAAAGAPLSELKSQPSSPTLVLRPQLSTLPGRAHSAPLNATVMSPKPQQLLLPRPHAIHYAASHGHSDCVTAVLKAGGDLNAMTTKGTPLYAAALHGHADAVARLLSAGADVNSGWTGMVASAVTQRSPVHAALIGGSADVLQLLLQAKADLSAFATVSLLCFASNHQCVQLLLKAGCAINAPEGSNAPLHRAAATDPESVSLLLAAGALVNAKNRGQSTALHLAAENSVESVQILLQHGARLEEANSTGHTALHIAAARNAAAARALCAAGANVNSVTLEDQHTPLHIAAGQNADSVRAILEAGPVVDAVDARGRTPLHVACEQKQADAVELLLKHGASPNARTARDDTPLHLAVNGKHLTQLLLAAGAQPIVVNHAGEQPIHLAARADVHSLRALIKHSADIDLNARTKNGVTPLYYASQVPDPQNIAFLLNDRRVDVNAADVKGRTSLHVAASLGLLPHVRALLEAGCDPLRADLDNHIPLDYAVVNNQFLCAHELSTFVQEHPPVSFAPEF